MPRLTTSPGRSSRAARAAIARFGSPLTAPLHEHVDVEVRRHDGLRLEPPTGTISPASAIVTVAAVAISGLKLRAVRRYQRLPSASARAA